MKRTKAFIYLALSAALFAGCKKDDIGYLSDRLYYELSPMEIPRGWEYRGIGINPDGSTRPLTFKLLHVNEKSTGKNMDDVFMKKYPMQAWKASFNLLTDSLKEQLLAKLHVIEAYPLNVEPSSGQVYAYYTTQNLPVGQYTFDVEISNLKGTKQYPKIGEFIIKDSVAFLGPVALGGSNTLGFVKNGQESVTKSGKAPVVTVDYEFQEENKLIVRYLDKNNVPFNPKNGEIVRRPQADGSFLQNYGTYAAKPELFDDRMEFFFPQLPFPVQSAGNGYNIYYRIPSNFIVYDDPTTNGFHAQPRTIYRFQKKGKYTVTVKLLDLSRKP